MLARRSPKHWAQLPLLLLLLTACGPSPADTPAPDVTPLPTDGPSSSVTPSPTTVPGDTPTPTYPVPANEATPWPTPLPTPTPVVPPMPIPTPSGLPTDAYIVQPGDTLSAIAAYHCGCDMEGLVALNGIEDAANLQVGQTLLLPVNTDRIGSKFPLLPDSEVVYSPAYLDFDADAFVQDQGMGICVLCGFRRAHGRSICS